MEGLEVTVIDVLPKKILCHDMPFLPRADLFRALAERDVTVCGDTKVLRFSPEGVTVEDPDGRRTIPCDTAVAAFGVRADTAPGAAM